MPKKPPPHSHDIAAFKEAVKGSKPIKQDKIHLKPKAPTRHIVKPKIAEEIIIIEDYSDSSPVTADEFISYKQLSISDKILRKLRKGQYTIEAKLDLHGMTVSQARMMVDDFIRTCLKFNYRVVLIIHGKGRSSQAPILKNKLNQWLRNTLHVLAFCSAQQSHGSRGAVYVLLKKQQGED